MVGSGDGAAVGAAIVGVADGARATRGAAGGVAVAVAVAVAVGVIVAVAVGVAGTGVRVAVGDGIAVGVGTTVVVGQPTSKTSPEINTASASPLRMIPPLAGVESRLRGLLEIAQDVRDHPIITALVELEYPGDPHFRRARSDDDLGALGVERGLVLISHVGAGRQ